MIKIESLDHLVLTVKDISVTCQFYTSILGMTSLDFKPGRTALHFGSQKINLHQLDRPVDANVKHAAPGSADLCFLTKTPIDRVVSTLQTLGVKIIEGPGDRTGAQGPIRSIYFYDPDENLIEVANQL